MDLVGVGVAVDADQLGLRVDAEFAHVVVLEEDAGDPGDLLVRPRPAGVVFETELRSFGAKFKSMASTRSLNLSCGLSVIILYSIRGK